MVSLVDIGAIELARVNRNRRQRRYLPAKRRPRYAKRASADCFRPRIKSGAGYSRETTSLWTPIRGGNAAVAVTCRDSPRRATYFLARARKQAVRSAAPVCSVRLHSLRKTRRADR